MTPSVRWLGDSALRVEWPDSVDVVLANQAAVAAAERLRAWRLPGVTDLIPAYRSLVVLYDPDVTTRATVARVITRVLGQEGGVVRAPRRFWVPVCYGGEWGPDLTDIAERVGLTPAEVIALHAGRDYHIFTVGFAPGFPYAGPLPERLRVPRRARPRTRVRPGSVAIADWQTGIYPVASPGGWHLLGHTPLSVFDPAANPPVAWGPGDVLRFVPVSAATYADLVARGLGVGEWEPDVHRG